MSKRLAIMGIPSCLGGNKRGCEKGPEAIRKELIPFLEKKKIPFKDYGDATEPTYCTMHGSYANCLQEIRKLNQNITYFLNKENVFAADNFPVLLGGDHSVNYSFIKRAAKYKKLGLMWFDAHGDFNTPDISPSGNVHGMVLAALAGKGLNEDFGDPSSEPILREENICIIGSRELDPKETELLKKTEINVYPMGDIEKRGLDNVLQDALVKLSKNTQAIHLSIDLDVFDPDIAPDVSTPSQKGLTQEDIYTIADAIKGHKITSMGLVELSPIKKDSHTRSDRQGTKCAQNQSSTKRNTKISTAKLIVKLIEAISKQIL